jgi:hypothetical protein
LPQRSCKTRGEIPMKELVAVEEAVNLGAEKIEGGMIF